VVSNTSPLSNLAIVGRLELFGSSEALIPPAVQAELSLNPKCNACVALDAALRQGWIRPRALAGPPTPNLLLSLHRGEAEALSLALESNAGLAYWMKLLRGEEPRNLASHSRVCSVSCAGPSKPTESRP
jgi:predicted nucleic acid-binding protein